VTTPSVHQISGADFDLLASGLGAGPSIRALSDGEVSRRRILICAVLEQLHDRPALRSAAEMLGQACAVLDQVEKDQPEAVRGRDGLLLHPFVGVWAADLLHRLSAETLEPEREIEARVSYLVAGAAAAAVAVGRSVTLDVVVPTAGLPVPGAGCFVLPERDHLVGARLTSGAGELALYLDDGRRAGWQPNRRLPEGDSGRLVLDDTDPYRDTFGQAAEPRLSADRATVWAKTVDAAWQLIKADYVDYLPGLDAGLRVITPLPTPSDGHDESASAQPAYGSIGSVLPPTPARLALLMMHEFQHVKLGALLHLVPLFGPDDGTRYHAPWRPDPRPLGALFQGTYAHLAVTDFWRRYRNHTEDDPVGAHEQFARWRAHTRDAIQVLLTAAALNDQGRRFVTGMATTMSSWDDDGGATVDLAAAERPGRLTMPAEGARHHESS
jgi:uncharacterized protein